VNNSIVAEKKRKRSTKLRRKMENNYQKSLAEQILTEARKMARLEVMMLAEEVLSEATTIARWEKKPFYIA